MFKYDHPPIHIPPPDTHTYTYVIYQWISSLFVGWLVGWFLATPCSLQDSLTRGRTRPRQWKRRVLTTGLPGNSQVVFKLKCASSEPPRGFVKIQISGSLPQSFWFSRSGVEPDKFLGDANALVYTGLHFENHQMNTHTHTDTHIYFQALSTKRSRRSDIQVVISMSSTISWFLKTIFH